MKKQWDYKVTRHTKNNPAKRDTPNLGLEPVLFYRKGGNKMSKFWDLVRESVITQGIITIILTTTVCYLAGTGQPVPDLIAYGFMSALSFFLGAKTQQILRR